MAGVLPLPVISLSDISTVTLPRRHARVIVIVPCNDGCKSVAFAKNEPLLK